MSALHLRTNGPKGSRERAALGAPRPRPPPCRACALPARVGLCKMASGPSRTAAEEYRPNRYVSLPAELDPATYDTSLEKRRAEAERLAIRARLKRQYLLQLNNPKPPAVIVSGAGGAGGGLWASPPHTDGSGPRQSLSPSRGLADGAVPSSPCDLGVCPSWPALLGPGGAVRPGGAFAGLLSHVLGLTVFLLPQEDPALLRWDYARTHNVYPTFRPTPKTSFLGAVFAIGPILFWIAAFKTERVSSAGGVEHHGAPGCKT